MGRAYLQVGIAVASGALSPPFLGKGQVGCRVRGFARSLGCLKGVAMRSRNRQVYTVGEAAELLGIGRSTAYELVARNELASIKIGGRRFVTQPTLEAILGIAPPLRPRSNTVDHSGEDHAGGAGPRIAGSEDHQATLHPLRAAAPPAVMSAPTSDRRSRPNVRTDGCTLSAGRWCRPIGRCCR